MAYAEIDACVAAGIDPERWDFLPKQAKVRVMAWHRISRLIAAHTEQAVADKIKKMRKRK